MPDKKLFRDEIVTEERIGAETHIAVGVPPSPGLERVVKNYSNQLFRMFPITYDDLEDLANGESLVPGECFLLSDATAATIGLIVKAATSSTIESKAVSVDFPSDEIFYDFPSDTILMRFDPLKNIGVGEDFRNPTNVFIDIETCSNIFIGKGSSGTIGANCTNITVGDECVSFNLLNQSNFVTIMNGGTGKGRMSNVQIGMNSSLIMDNLALNGNHFVNTILGNQATVNSPFQIGSSSFESSVTASFVALVLSKHFYASSDFSDANSILYTYQEDADIRADTGTGATVMCFWQFGTQTIIDSSAVL